MMDYQMLRLNPPYTGDKIAIAPLLSLISFLTLALIVWSYTIFPKGNNLILGLYVCILFFFFWHEEGSSSFSTRRPNIF